MDNLDYENLTLLEIEAIQANEDYDLQQEEIDRLIDLGVE